MYSRIRDLRKDRDLTQAEMGKILSCSQRTYSNYERGDLDIPTHVLCKLADFYMVSADYILGLTDEKRPYPPSKQRNDAPQASPHNSRYRMQSEYEKTAAQRAQSAAEHSLISHLKSKR